MALEKVKINTSETFEYIALNFTTGLTDLTVTVRRPDGTTFTPAPTIVEDQNGAYRYTYTPNVLGTWQERIVSPTNGDEAIRTYEVVSFELDDVKAQTDVIETKVDAVDGKVDDIDTKADQIINDISNIPSIKRGGYFSK